IRTKLSFASNAGTKTIFTSQASIIGSQFQDFYLKNKIVFQKKLRGQIIIIINMVGQDRTEANITDLDRFEFKQQAAVVLVAVNLACLVEEQVAMFLHVTQMVNFTLWML
ncbi:hypothetical protein ACJX0J_034662, partial [Zea mays]